MSVTNGERNVVLVGFMGTGKSTVGRLLAEKLGRPFIDSDEEIERRSGKTIPTLFAEDGESAFRELESRVIADLMAETALIVATGGGAVLREQNRQAMRYGGFVVALTADKATLVGRVTKAGADGTRPLLAGDAEERVSALLSSRKHAYDFAHAVLDTTRRTPAELAELLERWLR